MILREDSSRGSGIDLYNIVRHTVDWKENGVWEDSQNYRITHQQGGAVLAGRHS